MNNPPSPLRLLWRDRLTNFLCLNLLLLGATALGMDYTNARLGQELFNAAQHGNLEEAQRLIKEGASIEAKDNYGITPLILAAVTGHETMCKLLIDNKASLEAENNNGWTPLMLAAIEGHEDVCKLLIDSKASVEAEDNDGWTPLRMAATDGHKAVCKLLIDTQLNKPAIATFLGIVRKRPQSLPCQMQYDVAKIIAHQAFQLAKWPVIKQISMIASKKKRAKWSAYVNQQMNSPIK
jgi:ankyrin repeat protein